MRYASRCVLGAGQGEEFLLPYFFSRVRMMEKAALPERETERGSASLGARGQLSHVTSSCFWEKGRWGKRMGLLS